MIRSKHVFLAVVAAVIFAVGWYIAPKASEPAAAPAGQVAEAENGAGAAASSTTPDRVATTTIATPVNNQKPATTMITATISTTKGDIVVELFPQDAPKASENFASLAEKGYYDGVIFHRVIPGFMIQGGDPTGTGRGGPGYTFEDELDANTESAKRGYVRGTLAMANAGPNTNGSQFFIMHADYPLPHNYTIFGRVTSGIEVVDAIATTPRDGSDRPLEEISMKSVTVVRQ